MPDEDTTPRATKNVLIIDGARNCAYSLFAMTDQEFRTVFPGERQNVEFIEDLVERLGDERTGALMAPVWKRAVRKPDAIGIHGTIFYQLAHKKIFYPTKNDEEMVTGIGHK